MNQRTRLIGYCAAAGFLGGMLASIVLAIWVGKDSFRVFLGVPFVVIFLFPILGAVLAAAIGSVFSPESFGPLQGLVVSILAFIAFVLCHGIISAIWNYYPGSNIVMVAAAVFGADLIFGSILVGWVLAVVGLLTGAAFRRSNRNAL